MQNKLAGVWILLVAALLSSAAGRPQAGATDSAPATALRTVSDQEVKKIAHQLMAPCCWSQTADVHTSDTAKEMQAQIRAALQKGYDEKQVVAAFVAEYGERILATPRASGFNLMVWVLPGMALVLGGFAYWRYLQRTCALPLPKMKKLARTDETYTQRFERELAEYDS